MIWNGSDLTRLHLKKPMISMKKELTPGLFINLLARILYCWLPAQCDYKGRLNIVNRGTTAPLDGFYTFRMTKKGKLDGNCCFPGSREKEYQPVNSKTLDGNIVINGHAIAIRFSTLASNGLYIFQQIQEEGYDYLLCFGISPNEAHCWVFDREHALKNAIPQQSTEYRLDIDLKRLPDWIKGVWWKFGRSLSVPKDFEVEIETHIDISTLGFSIYPKIIEVSQFEYVRRSLTYSNCEFLLNFLIGS